MAVNNLDTKLHKLKGPFDFHQSLFGSQQDGVKSLTFLLTIGPFETAKKLYKKMHPYTALFEQKQGVITVLFKSNAGIVRA